jgi:hypothetical protein
MFRWDRQGVRTSRSSVPLRALANSPAASSCSVPAAWELPFCSSTIAFRAWAWPETRGAGSIMLWAVDGHVWVWSARCVLLETC